MENVANLLISPFAETWKAMTVQANTWSVMLEALRFLPQHSARLKLNEYLLSSSPELFDFPSRLKEIISDVDGPAVRAQVVITEGLDAIFFSSLVGAWAIFEASYEDVVVKILCNGAQITEILKEKKIKPYTKALVGSEEWARRIFKNMESRFSERESKEDSQSKKKNTIFEMQKEILAVFDVQLVYLDAKANKVEEINQIRNCILHRNGVIDKKAVTASPRLAQYLDKRIPITDPIFIEFMPLLVDYSFALLTALVTSPFLRAGLVPGSLDSSSK
jgi:hypothetical protein